MKTSSLLILASVLCFAGCGTKAAEKAPELTADAQAKLVLADKADGKEDKIVSKCAGCNLGMDGHADHAFTVGGYTLHLCSDKCVAKFKADANKELVALTVK